MKKVILMAMCIMGIIASANAQRLDYENRYIDGHAHKVLTPSLNNLQTLVNCTQSSFSTLMKQYDYKRSELSPSSYTSVLYDNAWLAFYMEGDGLGVNFIEFDEFNKSVCFSGEINKIYPQGYLSTLAKELQSYYLRKKDGVDEFVIQKQKGGYLIRITSLEGRYFVRIYRFDE